MSVKFRSLRAVLFLSLLAIGVAHAQVDVWTHHNDNARSGQNLAETQLDTTSVNVSTFGKLWSYAVDGDVYAQLLVLRNVAVPGKGTHDVVYVATMNNSVYAFDADDNVGTGGQPLWTVNFNNPAAGVTPVPVDDVASGGNIRVGGVIGITGTPVIDMASSTMYFVVRTKESGSYVQRLHALDVRSGAEKAGSPVLIQAGVPGTATDSVGGIVSFNPKTQNQRAGLALAGGKVYIAWASHEDRIPYHGWILAYDAATLAQVGVLCTSPFGMLSGIWHAGEAPAVDASGNVYVMTGNGSFNGVNNWGMSILKMNPALTSVLDWFTPDNWSALNSADSDLGSSGALLVPGTNYVMGGGKSGIFFVLDRASMGHVVTGNTQVVQNWKAAQGHIHGSPVYWNGPNGPQVYVWGETDFLKAFKLNGAAFDMVPASQSVVKAPPGMPGGFLSISANGGTGGSGILWAVLPTALNAETAVVNGTLRAFDASDVSKEIWNSRQNLARDDIGNFAKYVPPTIANGRLYLPSFSNQVHVYGLLGSQPPPSGGQLSMTSPAPAALVDLTATGTLDWAHWPGYDHKASGGGAISSFSLIGGATSATTYTNDTRTLSWSDGAPTASGASTSGVFVSGVGRGFVVSAPADTTTRTLTLYVGGNNSRGQFRAYLSDNSAAPVTDTGLSATTPYRGVYVLTYHAASAGQTLGVEWSHFSGSGNVNIQGATLVDGGGSGGPPPVPTGVSATDGTATNSVTVSWNASSGATTYTVYRSTSAGTQGPVTGSSGSTSLVDTTVTPGTVYWYSVVASGPGGTSAVSAQDSGYARVPATGSLTGTVSGSATTVDLTAAGTADWAHWPGYDHKSSGGSQVQDFTAIGGTAQTYANDPRRLTWSDGTPTAIGSSTSGVVVTGVDKGFRVIAPADTMTRTLTVYVGGSNSTGQLTAHLSDGSAADYVDASRSGAAQYDGVYTLAYKAGSAGQSLQVQWVQTTATGNVTLQAATLIGGVLMPPPAPTNVAATDGTSTTSVTVTWSPAIGAASYTVYRSTTAGTQGSSIGTPTGTSFVDTTAVAGTTYYYGVTASGVGGTSPLSAQDSGYRATPPPGVPANVAATDGTSIASVTVTWSPVAGAASYAVYRSTTAGTQGASIGTPTGTSLVDATAVAGTTYYYGVTASGAGGTSALSAQDSGYRAVARVASKLRDFDGSGKSDLLWQNDVTGAHLLWLMDGAATLDSGTFFTGPGWDVTHTAYFDADAKADILWRNPASGRVVMWLMNGKSVASSADLLADPSWKVGFVGDFNGDGNADLVWQNSTTNQVVIWLMNGSTSIGGAQFSTDPAWRVVQVGDFDGDGKTDLLWRNDGTGETRMWLMDGTAPKAIATLLVDPAWTVTHVGDFDGDGKADILWRSTSGQTTMWLMNGTARAAAAGLPADASWTVDRIVDLDGDGRSDIVWANGSGQVLAWLMHGTSIAGSGQILPAGTTLGIVATGDYNGDGKTDLILRDSASGHGVMWLMSGATPIATFTILTDPQDRVTP